MRFIQTSAYTFEISHLHISGDKSLLAIAKKKKKDKSVYLEVVDLFSSSFKQLKNSKIDLYEDRKEEL